ncbi:hypothetical protein ACLOJK_022266 [Asimina triloba]
MPAVCLLRSTTVGEEGRIGVGGAGLFVGFHLPRSQPQGSRWRLGEAPVRAIHQSLLFFLLRRFLYLSYFWISIIPFRLLVLSEVGKWEGRREKGEGRREREMGGMLKLAVADAVLTFLWVFSIATLGTASSLISSALKIEGAPTLLITTALVSLLVFLFTFLGQALGGASFNPTGTASFYAAGVGSGNLFSIALRLPAQAAGAVGGALAIMEFMPSQYKKNLRGPSLKVDLHTGAIAEGVLTFIISFLVLCIILKGPKNMLLKTWLIAISTVSLVVVGSSYTGPAMNPANSFKAEKADCVEAILWVHHNALEYGSGVMFKGIGTMNLQKQFCNLSLFASFRGTPTMFSGAYVATPLRREIAFDDNEDEHDACLGMALLQAFGWAYVNNRHNTWEQFYVYWICPFVGAIVAAWVFRVVFPPPVKQKKA